MNLHGSSDMTRTSASIRILICCCPFLVATPATAVECVFAEKPPGGPLDGHAHGPDAVTGRQARFDASARIMQFAMRYIF